MNDNLVVPNHVGIIMDGNGRWAQERGMVRTMGHKNAIKTLKELCDRVIWLHDGKIKEIGASEEVVEHYEKFMMEEA